MTDSFETRDAIYAEVLERAANTRNGIGAIFLGNASAASDGWRGMVAISDGGTVIEVLVATTGQPRLGSGSVRPDVVAGLVEEMAGDYDDEDRLHAIQEATSSGPGLRLD